MCYNNNLPGFFSADEAPSTPAPPPPPPVPEEETNATPEALDPTGIGIWAKNTAKMKGMENNEVDD